MSYLENMNEKDKDKGEVLGGSNNGGKNRNEK